jgi:hypothetical protein
MQSPCVTAIQLHFVSDKDDLTSCIKQASSREAEVIEGLRSLDKHSPHTLTNGTMLWKEEDGLVFYKGKLYIPNDHTLRTL